MLKKKASGGPPAAEPATQTGCGDRDPQPPPSPPASKVARRSNGGSSRASLLLSTRSLPSLLSTDRPVKPVSTAEPSKTPPPCICPRNGGTGRSGSSYHGAGTQAAGLAEVLVAGEADGGRVETGRVLFGMRLRVQLLPRPAPTDLPGGSPIEFGVKNRDAQLALLSPVQRSPLSSAARAARRSEEEEEELAEDYTCVIARGPNPKMTHIFEDRVVESRAGAGDGDACCLLSSCSGCELRRGGSLAAER